MKTLLSAVVLSLAGGLAFAGQCPAIMKQIDDKLAMKPAVSEADMAKVKKLRDEGEALHKAGKHAESVQALNDAKKLLGM